MTSSPVWVAAAVGDSCVLHLRPNADGYTLLESFPHTTASEFSNHPNLLGSTDSQAGVVPDAAVAGAALQRGDQLVLATDALAKFALERAERGNDLWQRLVDPNPIAGELDAWRSEGLEVDDITRVVVAGF